MKLNKFFELPKGIQLLPLLLFYIIIIVFWKIPTETAGDEGRYLSFANNLMNGFYSPAFPNINLWNGPGFPLFLVPFLYLKFSYVQLRLINAFLLYVALIFTYKTASKYSPYKNAFIITFITGFYIPSFQMLRFIHTESLTWLILSAIVYLVIENFNKYKVYIGLLLGYLILVKVIFIYVAIFSAIVAFIFYLKNNTNTLIKPVIISLILSIIVTIPYLFYTYTLTNKPFYITNSGGLSLYTMSTLNPNEYGDWDISTKFNQTKEHQLIYQQALQSNPIQRDSLYKSAAIKNISKAPFKYCKNWVFNVSRLLFETPYSYTKFSLKLLIYIIPGLFALTMIILSLMNFIRNFHLMNQTTFILLIFFLLYLGLCTLLSAYGRMFFITIPFWTIFYSKTKFDSQNQSHL